jgi:hypothetical protein
MVPASALFTYSFCAVQPIYKYFISKTLSLIIVSEFSHNEEDSVGKHYKISRPAFAVN